MRVRGLDGVEREYDIRTGTENSSHDNASELERMFRECGALSFPTTGTTYLTRSLDCRTNASQQPAGAEAEHG